MVAKLTVNKSYFPFLVFVSIIFLTGNLYGVKRNSVAQYIEQWSPVAIQEMHIYGIPASIKLAQGILESDYGNSTLARKAKNHFGIKCHGWAGATFYQDDDTEDECFRAYKDAAESFSDHSKFLYSRPRYARLFELDITDYKGWAKGLRKAGYATNPRYAELLIGIIERHKLARFDRMAMTMVALQTYPLPRTRQSITETSPASEEIFPVPLSGPRQELTNNRIRYIRARPGDTPESIAREMKMRVWQIKKYNELNENRKIIPGQIIYLQPKRRKSKFPSHIVQQGETMYDISQRYGIKLKHLYKRNEMEEGTHPSPGQEIILRGRL